MKLFHHAQTHIGRRSENQDRLRIVETPNFNLYVVCDGMGGHEGGAQAAEFAIDSVFENLPIDQELSEDLIRSFVTTVHRDVRSKCYSLGLIEAGTTIVLAFIEKDLTTWIAHVGDSRAYLSREDYLYPMTKDHSYGSSLTQAIGIDLRFLQVPINRFQLKENERLLLCSDGLHGAIPDWIISSIISSNNPLDKINYYLIDTALKSGGSDNISVILIEVTP